MADEFIKGLGIFTGSALGWVVLAGWYRTPTFESTQQLVGPVSAGTGVFNTLAVNLMDVLFWFALIGPLAFWVLLPAFRRAQSALEDRRNA